MKKIVIVSAVLASVLVAQNYNQDANKIAKELIKNLGGNLKKELKANGAVSAMKYCHAHAYELSKKVSDSYENVEVKRVSLKPRNPANEPNAKEKAVLKSMHKSINSGVKPHNFKVEDEKKVVVYKPLVIKKKACLICHGDVAKNRPKLAKKIAQLYPTDKATGYKMNDMRGAIVVTFTKK